MYRLLRPILFLLDAERSHEFVFSLLRLLYLVPGMGFLLHLFYAGRVPDLPVQTMGMRFPNPVGLAAGLDKNGECVQPLMDLGFGWLELGTITPQAQTGNPRKRLFRLPSHRITSYNVCYTKLLRGPRPLRTLLIPRVHHLTDREFRSAL